MRPSWLRFTTALCLLSLACSHALGAESIMLKVPSQSGTEPKYLALPNGSKGGICIDVFRAIEQLEPTNRFSRDQELNPPHVSKPRWQRAR